MSFWKQLAHADFSIDDKNLPLKLTASFTAAATAITLPIVGAAVFVSRIISDSNISRATQMGILVGCAYLSAQYLRRTLEDKLQAIGSQRYIRHVDCSGMPIFTGIVAGGSLNAYALQVLGHAQTIQSSPLPLLIFGLAAVGACWNKLSVLTYENNFRPTGRPGSSKPGNDTHL